MSTATKQYTKTLTGGTTYDVVTDTTIPRYLAIQVLNDTLVDFYVKYNSDTATKKYAVDAIFFNECKSEKEPLKDTISINGTGTITVELRYESNT